MNPVILIVIEIIIAALAVATAYVFSAWLFRIKAQQLLARHELILQQHAAQSLPPQTFQPQDAASPALYAELYAKLYTLKHTAEFILKGRAPFTDLSHRDYITEALHQAGMPKKAITKALNRDGALMGEQALLQELNALYTEWTYRSFEREYHEAFAYVARTEFYFPPAIVDAVSQLESSLRPILLKMPLQRSDCAQMLDEQFHTLRAQFKQLAEGSDFPATPRQNTPA